MKSAFLRAVEVQERFCGMSFEGVKPRRAFHSTILSEIGDFLERFSSAKVDDRLACEDAFLSLKDSEHCYHVGSYYAGCIRRHCLTRYIQGLTGLIIHVHLDDFALDSAAGWFDRYVALDNGGTERHTDRDSCLNELEQSIQFLRPIRERLLQGGEAAYCLGVDTRARQLLEQLRSACDFIPKRLMSVREKLLNAPDGVAREEARREWQRYFEILPGHHSLASWADLLLRMDAELARKQPQRWAMVTTPTQADNAKRLGLLSDAEYRGTMRGFVKNGALSEDEYREKVQDTADGAEQRRLAGLTLSTKETADQLGISKTTVTDLIASGNLEATKDGRRWCIRGEDIEAFLKRIGRKNIIGETASSLGAAIYQGDVRQWVRLEGPLLTIEEEKAQVLAHHRDLRQRRPHDYKFADRPVKGAIERPDPNYTLRMSHYPTYAIMTPQQRWQYHEWLREPLQFVDLQYVFVRLHDLVHELEKIGREGSKDETVAALQREAEVLVDLYAYNASALFYGVGVLALVYHLPQLATQWEEEKRKREEDLRKREEERAARERPILEAFLAALEANAVLDDAAEEEEEEESDADVLPHEEGLSAEGREIDPQDSNALSPSLFERLGISMGPVANRHQRHRLMSTYSSAPLIAFYSSLEARHAQRPSYTRALGSKKFLVTPPSPEASRRFAIGRSDETAPMNTKGPLSLEDEIASFEFLIEEDDTDLLWHREYGFRVRIRNRSAGSLMVDWGKASFLVPTQPRSLGVRSILETLSMPKSRVEYADWLRSRLVRGVEENPVKLQPGAAWIGWLVVVDHPFLWLTFPFAEFARDSRVESFDLTFTLQTSGQQRPYRVKFVRV